MENPQLKIYAKKYWELGLNVTCIGSYLTDYNFHTKNILKTPNHDWQTFINRRQEFNELENLDWENAFGLGIITGTENYLNPKGSLLLIDIDGCISLEFINSFLKLLNLPENYEWVIRSGSGCGYHIFIYSDTEEIDLFKYNFKNGCSYLPYDLFSSQFLKIELLWKSNAVLPPSLHMSSNKYEFINCLFPQKIPAYVNKDLLLKKTILSFCRTDPVNISSDRDTIPGPFNRESETKLEFEEGPGSYNRQLINNILIEENDNTIMSQIYYLVFDIETDGLIIKENSNNQYPTILQITWYLINEKHEILKRKTYLINPDNISTNKAFDINHLDISINKKVGMKLFDILREFSSDSFYAKKIVAHNIEFDLDIINHYLNKYNLQNYVSNKETICTMKSSVSLFNDGLYPSLNKLYCRLYNNNDITNDLHNSEFDAFITVKCLFKLFESKIVKYEDKYKKFEEKCDKINNYTYYHLYDDLYINDYIRDTLGLDIVWDIDWEGGDFFPKLEE